MPVRIGRTTRCRRSARRGKTPSPSPACPCSRRARIAEIGAAAERLLFGDQLLLQLGAAVNLPRIVDVRPLAESSRTGFPSRKSEPSSCLARRTARNSIWPIERILHREAERLDRFQSPNVPTRTSKTNPSAG